MEVKTFRSSIDFFATWYAREGPLLMWFAWTSWLHGGLDVLSHLNWTLRSTSIATYAWIYSAFTLDFDDA